MNCFSDVPARLEDHRARWAWYELGSIILYVAAIGVSIAIALTNLRIGF
ncbi:MAG TPA: hypothetical protein HA263_11845 [Methanoregulaceae archaeon]|nr:hypothetical protein [Methanoregulaceae archaeon]